MCRRSVACFALILTFSLPLLATTGEEDAREAAVRFGRALTLSDPSAMAPLLPERGKVHLNLTRLGPETGSFGSKQVEALFGDFLTQGSVRTFEVLRLECDGDAYAVVQGRARIVDRDGRTATVDLHLAFQPEDDRWVLREIRETGR